MGSKRYFCSISGGSGSGSSSAWGKSCRMQREMALLVSQMCIRDSYKTYTSPAECEAQLRQLLADPAAILAMAQHNAAYYQAWLRPEQQVRQALRQLETGEM